MLTNNVIFATNPNTICKCKKNQTCLKSSMFQ